LSAPYTFASDFILDLHQRDIADIVFSTSLTLLSTSRACRTNGIDSVLGKKGFTLDWMKSKVHLFMECGSEALIRVIVKHSPFWQQEILDDNNNG
jgi:hypothetical protein